jgi:EmrB/QacA subfamily drug resistance transporter
MTDTTNTPPAAEATGGLLERGYRHRGKVLAVVIIADVMDLVDATVAQLAGPSIRRDLGGSESTLQWFLAAYTLTFAVGLITSARAGDLLGRRRMFVTGMVGFTVASLLCGLAPSAGLLIAARVVQGFFGAVMIPQGFAMVKSSYHEDDLQKALTPFGPVMGLSAVLGPIIAGVLLKADLFGTGWRMVFLINLPIGAAASYLAYRYLPEDSRHEGRATKMDPLGTVLLTVASAMLIYPLVQGRELGWPAWTFGLMAASLVVFFLFVLNERRSEDPVIEPSLFRHRGFVFGVLFLGIFFLAMVGLGLVLNLLIQYGLGFGPLKAGLTQVPWAFGIAVGATLSGAWLGPKLGRHVLHIGLTIMALGLVYLWWNIGHPGDALDQWDFVIPMLGAGIGCGLIFAPLFDLVLADLGDAEIGTGSGLLNAVQQFSGAVGVASLGTLLFQIAPHEGLIDASRWVILASVGCVAAAGAAALLLPMKGREGAEVH